MRKVTLLIIGFFALSFQSQIVQAAENKNPAWVEQVEKITELKGSFNTEEGVFKVTSPRAQCFS